MKKFAYTITQKEGLHSRPAGLLAKEAAKYDCRVTVKNCETGKRANAKELYSLAKLSIKYDTGVEIVAQGRDEVAAIENLEQFFEHNL